MPTISDLVGDEAFWKFPADRRALMAKKVDPGFAKFSDDRIEVMLNKIRQGRPNSVAAGKTDAEQAVSRAFEPPVAVTFKPDKRTGEVKVGYGITPTGRQNIAQAVRIAGAVSAIVPGGAVARGVVGATGEVITETGEMMSGDRSGYNPLAIGVAGLTSAVIPGVGGNVTRDVVKGGVYGFTSHTLNNWARGKPALESPGMAAVSTLTSGLASGVLSKYYRGSVNELLPRKEADMAIDILEGRVPADLRGQWAGAEETVKDVKAMRKAAAAAKRQARSFVGPPEPPKPPPFVGPPEPPTSALDSSWGVMRKWRRMKDWMAHVQDKTGLPTLDIYTNTREGLSKAVQQLGQASEEIKRTFKGVKQARRITMQAWMEANPKNRDKVAMLLGMSKDDIRKTEDLESFLDKEFKQRGLSWEKFSQDVMPRVRSKGTLENAYPTGHLPKEAEFFKDEFESDMIGSHTRDSLALTLRLLRSFAYGEHVEPQLKIADKLLANPKMTQEIRKPYMAYLSTVKGKNEDFANTLAKWYTDVANKIPGVDITQKDARALVDTMVGLQYTSTLAFRGGPLVRNSFQGMQTGYPMIGKWYFKGLKASFTKEGQALVERSGVLAGDPQYREALRATEGMTGEGVMANTSRGLNRLQSWGMKAYGKIDDKHLSSMYLGQYMMVEEAAKKGKSIDQIIDLADLDTFTKPETDRWRKMLGDGNFKGVADEAGKARAYDTQWSNMLPGDKPPILEGFGGRTIGGFNNWALQYGDYLRRNVMGPQPTAKKLRWFARWASVNSLMLAVGAASAYKMGYEHPIVSGLSNTFLSPGIPSGGPFLELSLSAVEASIEHAKGYSGRGSAKFVDNMNATFVPFHQLWKTDRPDWMKMLEEEDPKYLLRLLGQAPRTPLERKR